jgi:outer membrane protein assembly factor BamB
MRRSRRFVCLAAALAGALAANAADPPAGSRDALWAAVRAGDVKAAAAALDRGVAVDARNEINVTALWIASTKGKPEVIELLLARGADPTARDGIWYQTPLTNAVGYGHAEAVKLLLKAGAKDADAAVVRAVSGGNVTILRAVLDGSKPTKDALDAALFAAPKGAAEIRAALEKAGAVALPTAAPKDREAWGPLAGTYESDNGGQLTITLKDVGLVVSRGGSQVLLRPCGPDAFTVLGVGEVRYAFERKDGKPTRVVVKAYTSEVTYYRTELKPVAQPDATATVVTGSAAPPMNWPQFRGPGASGVADGQDPPATWDVEAGTNVRWKTPIPGLGHSCPVVWGGRVFLTSAVGGNTKVRTGNYGDPSSVKDDCPHAFQVLCLDRDTGKVLWTRTAFEGVPKVKRHLKGSHANCTPATDGRRVVACFGSEGLYCYDFEGNLVWKRDLGSLDSSFAIEQQYEWGFASSPVIHEGLVLLQCDLSKDSFLAAYRLEDGSLVWSTPRDEIPSWSTPTVWRNRQRVEVVTNASQYARGYDPESGKELWRLDKKSEATVPTPVVSPDLAFVVSGNRPIQPLFAVRPGAAGDISLNEGETQGDHVAWARMRGGPYMPTPILYGPYLYTCGNGGMVTCYEAATGKEVYKERLGGGSYTASPVVADGRIYFASEQGEVRVVKAGPQFKLLAVNKVGGTCMATPAISGGVLFVRTTDALLALGRK